MKTIRTGRGEAPTRKLTSLLLLSDFRSHGPGEEGPEGRGGRPCSSHERVRGGPAGRSRSVLFRPSSLSLTCDFLSRLQLWYLLIFVANFALGCAAISAWPTELPSEFVSGRPTGCPNEGLELTASRRILSLGLCIQPLSCFCVHPPHRHHPSRYKCTDRIERTCYPLSAKRRVKRADFASLLSCRSLPS